MVWKLLSFWGVKRPIFRDKLAGFVSGISFWTPSFEGILLPFAQAKSSLASCEKNQSLGLFFFFNWEADLNRNIVSVNMIIFTDTEEWYGDGQMLI